MFPVVVEFTLRGMGCVYVASCHVDLKSRFGDCIIVVSSDEDGRFVTHDNNPDDLAGNLGVGAAELS